MFCSDTSTYTLVFIGEVIFSIMFQYFYIYPCTYLDDISIERPYLPLPCCLPIKKRKRKERKWHYFCFDIEGVEKKKKKCQHKIPIFLWTTLSLIMKLFTYLACYWKWHYSCFNRLFAAPTPVMVYMLMFVFQLFPHTLHSGKMSIVKNYGKPESLDHHLKWNLGFQLGSFIFQMQYCILSLV